MTYSKFRFATLFVSGLIAVLIGAAIVLDPAGFHASSGIHLGAGDTALLNEMRAAGWTCPRNGLSGNHWPLCLQTSVACPDRQCLFLYRLRFGPARQPDIGWRA